jgi:hypothetical protein
VIVNEESLKILSGIALSINLSISSFETKQKREEELAAIFFKTGLSLLAIYRLIDSEYDNQSEYRICNRLLVDFY